MYLLYDYILPHTFLSLYSTYFIFCMGGCSHTVCLWMLAANKERGPLPPPVGWGVPFYLTRAVGTPIYIFAAHRHGHVQVGLSCKN